MSFSEFDGMERATPTMVNRNFLANSSLPIKSCATSPKVPAKPSNIGLSKGVGTPSIWRKASGDILAAKAARAVTRSPDKARNSTMI